MKIRTISDMFRAVSARRSYRGMVAAAVVCLGVGAANSPAGTATSGAMFSFHLMQIEAVIGGVNGDVAAQAVELRTRAVGQNFIAGTRIIAYDAAGLNPVTLIQFPSNVSGSAAGTRILVATSAFITNTTPNAAPDFMMTNLIPQSYLAAGRITFEDGFGTILWSLAYGGANYTGPTTGSLNNDADGEFGPAFGGPLATTSTQALHFQGLAADMSTSNSADYLLTPGAAVFFNVAGGRFAVGDGTSFTFEIVGHCPGTVNLTWSGATPSRTLALIFGSSLGNLAIPDGNPCAGTRLGIGPQNAQLIQTITTGPNGINSINGNTSSGACNSYLQLLDVDTCRTSNVERITP